MLDIYSDLLLDCSLVSIVTPVLLFMFQSFLLEETRDKKQSYLKHSEPWPISICSHSDKNGQRCLCPHLPSMDGGVLLKETHFQHNDSWRIISQTSQLARCASTSYG